MFADSSSTGAYQAAELYLASGTSLDGIYTGTVTIPQYSEQGTWSINSVHLEDNAGNFSTIYTSQLQADGFPSSFQQTGMGDTTPPTLAGFSFTPTTVDTSNGTATITFTAHITDDISGVSNTNDGVTVFADSPSTGAYQATELYLASGTSLDGIYTGTITIPQYSEQGTWSINSVHLEDNAGNVSTIYTSQLQADGFPSSFQNGNLTPSAPTGLTARQNPTKTAPQLYWNASTDANSLYNIYRNNTKIASTTTTTYTDTTAPKGNSTYYVILQ